MFYVNKHIIIGNVGKEIKQRSSKDGKLFMTFTVATSKSWVNKQSGERESNTEWHNIAVFNEMLAKQALKRLVKGSKVFIEGSPRKTIKTINGVIQTYHTTVVDKFEGQIVFLEKAQNYNQQTENQIADDEFSPTSNTQTLPKVGQYAAPNKSDIIPPQVKKVNPKEGLEAPDDSAFDDIPF